MNSSLYAICAIYVFIFGLCIGSFLNVVILRGLKGESIVFGRSKCPKCQNQLKWYMNIPLLSYLFLRGKCAYCACPISVQYPLVELGTALLFLADFFAFGISYKTLFLFVILSLFMVLFVTDLKEMVILDIHAYILLAVCLIFCAFNFGYVNIIQSLIGAISGFLIFELLSKIGVLLVKFRMFGEGDSYIALSLGALFGVKNLLILIALSFVIQCVFAVPALIKNAFLLNKKKLAISYIFIFISILLLPFLNKLSYSMHLAAAVLITLFLLFALKNVVIELKNKTANNFEEAQEQFCIMPFGPALIIAATVLVFYLPQIKSIIINYFS